MERKDADAPREKTFTVEVKDLSASEPRTLLITGSTESVDRDGDVIECSGWRLENYLKNPVVLWAHDYSRPPVAMAKQVFVDQRAKKLSFKLYFPRIDELGSPGAPPSDHALFVDTLYNMYRASMLNASSVGFRGLKSAPREDDADKPMWARGVRFTEQELVELSLVPVPANAEALVQARSFKGLNPKGLELVEKAIEEAQKDTGEESENTEAPEKEDNEKGEDMANELTPEESKKLKAFLATLEDGSPLKKTGARLSKASREKLDKAIEHASNCMTSLKDLASDGVEENEEGASDGVTDPKAIDLSTLSVEEADDILRASGKHEGV